MAGTKRKPQQAEPPAEPARAPAAPDDPAASRPPDSAEDFEHVLRRLIARRDRGKADT